MAVTLNKIRSKFRTLYTINLTTKNQVHGLIETYISLLELRKRVVQMLGIMKSDDPDDDDIDDSRDDDRVVKPREVSEH